MRIELNGLRIAGRHGAYPKEREQSRAFVFDVELEVGASGLSDRLEDAVDYDEVARAVQELSSARDYNLLEALAAATAEELVRRFGVDGATVRIRKPGIRPGGLEADEVAVSASRP
jgi:dihydroneopterin aldolase